MTDSQSQEKEITPAERGIIDIVRLNKATPRVEVRREWQLGRWRFVYNRRSSKNLWGRFGGGWNWELGFQAGGSTVILNLLVASLRIERRKAS